MGKLLNNSADQVFPADQCQGVIMGRLSRRQFLIQSSNTVVATTASGLLSAEQNLPSIEAQKETYQSKKITKLTYLSNLSPYLFHYPDSASPCFLIKLGKRIESGIGPEEDLIAFSGLCPHMGCGLIFNADQKSFECPCHFSIFDCESKGQMVIGQATQDLPQVLLRYDQESGDIEATGVLGMLYGRVSNVLPGGGA
jgi:arsenite oxidase small subunit